MAPPQKHPRVKSDHLVSLLPALRALSGLLQASRTKGIIIGGVAASLLGHPRMTADIDATVFLEENAIEAFLDLARAHGLVARLPDPLGFARRSSMLLLKDKASGIAVDLALGSLHFERLATSRANFVKLEDFSVPLPRPEDLIIMKAVAHRPRDIDDIRGIVECQPSLDKAYIRRETTRFARALSMPQLWTDIAGLFKATEPHTSSRGKKKR